MLIDDIVRLSGPLPNEARYRNWLEGQNMAALEKRLQQLENEKKTPAFKGRSQNRQGRCTPAQPLDGPVCLDDERPQPERVVPLKQ